MKKKILLMMCLLLGIVIGAGSFLIYDLATDNKSSTYPTSNQFSGYSVLSDGINHSLVDISYEVISYLKAGDFKSLSALVHEDYGIYFSPYSNINLSSNQWFSADSLAKLDNDPTVYVWGVYDGSGEPIAMTASDYLTNFLYARDYSTASVITINRISKSGNSLENTLEVFPEAQFVDFYIPPQSDDGLDWSLLRLIYEDNDGIPRLVAIVHNEYTV